MKTETVNGVMTVKLSGEIDHHSSAKLRTAIDQALVGQRPDGLILDFSAVTFMDSSGVGLVMGRYKKAQSVRCEVTLTGLSERDSRMMKLSGIEKIVKIR